MSEIQYYQPTAEQIEAINRHNNERKLILEKVVEKHRLKEEERRKKFVKGGKKQ